MDRPEKPVIRVSKAWLEMLNRVKDQPGRIVIIGAADSGKSVLAQWLRTKLPEWGSTAAIDGDVGQCEFGPPGVVTNWLVGQQMRHSYFVGDTTPVSRPAAVLSAFARSLRDVEASGARFTVINTTGYVDGDGAVALKTAKVEMLAPAHIIVLGDSSAMRRLRKCWQGYEDVTVTPVGLADNLRTKTAAERRENRRERFADALQGSNMRWLALRDIAVQTITDAPPISPDGGPLLGFVDEHRRLVCIGILHAIDHKSRRLLVYAPEIVESATGVIFGNLSLNSGGFEIGRSRSEGKTR